MNEGMRPIWFDSSTIYEGTSKRIALLFYYGGDISEITVLNRINGKSDKFSVVNRGGHIYGRFISNSTIAGQDGYLNDGDMVIFDATQENPIYSNRISKR